MNLKFDSMYSCCPLCSSTDINFLFNILHNNYQYDIWLCDSCSFRFMNPVYSNDSLLSMYSKDYYSGKSSYGYLDERQNETASSYVWNARLKTIRKHKSSGRFLDIGASFGGFMACASKYYDVYGIEPSNYAATYADSRFSNRVHHGTLDDHPYASSFFDVITMIEVIEHLKQPVDILQKCFDLLAPDGLLVVQTADCEAWQSVNAGSQYHYYLPGHVSLFSEKSFARALENAGFKQIKVYRPVDFCLMAKLRKSKSSFTKLTDYLAWLRISAYHFKGFLRYKNKPLVSSMVIYARKPEL